jgi:hypothetical protein
VWLCHIASSCQDTSHIGLRLTLVTSFNFNHLFKGPVAKKSPSEVLELEIQQKNF